MLVGLPVAVAASMAIGLVVSTDYGPDDFLAIATLAFAEIVRYLINYWEDLTGGSLGLFGYRRAGRRRPRGSRRNSSDSG